MPVEISHSAYKFSRHICPHCSKLFPKRPWLEHHLVSCLPKPKKLPASSKALPSKKQPRIATGKSKDCKSFRVGCPFCMMSRHKYRSLWHLQKHIASKHRKTGEGGTQGKRHPCKDHLRKGHSVCSRYAPTLHHNTSAGLCHKTSAGRPMKCKLWKQSKKSPLECHLCRNTDNKFENMDQLSVHSLNMHTPRIHLTKCFPEGSQHFGKKKASVKEENVKQKSRMATAVAKDSTKCVPPLKMYLWKCLKCAVDGHDRIFHTYADLNNHISVDHQQEDGTAKVESQSAVKVDKHIADTIELQSLNTGVDKCIAFQVRISIAEDNRAANEHDKGNNDEEMHSTVSTPDSQLDCQYSVGDNNQMPVDDQAEAVADSPVKESQNSISTNMMSTSKEIQVGDERVWNFGLCTNEGDDNDGRQEETVEREHIIGANMNEEMCDEDMVVDSPPEIQVYESSVDVQDTESQENDNPNGQPQISSDNLSIASKNLSVQTQKTCRETWSMKKDGTGRDAGSSSSNRVGTVDLDMECETDEDYMPVGYFLPEITSKKDNDGNSSKPFEGENRAIETEVVCGNKMLANLCRLNVENNLTDGEDHCIDKVAKLTEECEPSTEKIVKSPVYNETACDQMSYHSTSDSNGDKYTNATVKIKQESDRTRPKGGFDVNTQPKIHPTIDNLSSTLGDQKHVKTPDSFKENRNPRNNDAKDISSKKMLRDQGIAKNQESMHNSAGGIDSSIQDITDDQGGVHVHDAGSICANKPSAVESTHDSCKDSGLGNVQLLDSTKAVSPVNAPHSKNSADYTYHLSSLDDQLSMITGSPSGRYYCQVCQLNLNKSIMPLVHMRSHAEKTPYHCGLCDFKSSLKSAMLTHLNANHKIKHPRGVKRSLVFTNTKCTEGELKTKRNRLFNSMNDAEKRQNTTSKNSSKDKPVDRDVISTLELPPSQSARDWCRREQLLLQSISSDMNNSELSTLKSTGIVPIIKQEVDEKTMPSDARMDWNGFGGRNEQINTGQSTNDDCSGSINDDLVICDDTNDAPNDNSEKTLSSKGVSVVSKDSRAENLSTQVSNHREMEVASKTYSASSDILQAQKCDCSFEPGKFAQQFLKQLHSNVVTCPICGLSFSDKHAAFDHTLYHTIEVPYRCSHCKYRAKTVVLMYDHIEYHHGIKKPNLPIWHGGLINCETSEFGKRPSTTNDSSSEMVPNHTNGNVSSIASSPGNSDIQTNQEVLSKAHTDINAGHTSCSDPLIRSCEDVQKDEEGSLAAGQNKNISSSNTASNNGVPIMTANHVRITPTENEKLMEWMINGVCIQNNDSQFKMNAELQRILFQLTHSVFPTTCKEEPCVRAGKTKMHSSIHTLFCHMLLHRKERPYSCRHCNYVTHGPAYLYKHIINKHGVPNPWRLPEVDVIYKTLSSHYLPPATQITLPETTSEQLINQTASTSMNAESGTSATTRAKSVAKSVEKSAVTSMFRISGEQPLIRPASGAAGSGVSRRDMPSKGNDIEMSSEYSQMRDLATAEAGSPIIPSTENGAVSNTGNGECRINERPNSANIRNDCGSESTGEGLARAEGSSLNCGGSAINGPTTEENGISPERNRHAIKYVQKVEFIYSPSKEEERLQMDIEMHSLKYVNCTFCHQQFDVTNIFTHIRTSHQKTLPFSCCQCDFKSVKLADMMPHLRYTHLETSPELSKVFHICNWQNKNYHEVYMKPSDMALKRSQIYHCNACNFKTFVLVNIRWHIQNCHKVMLGLKKNPFSGLYWCAACNHAWVDSEIAVKHKCGYADIVMRRLISNKKDALQCKYCQYTAKTPAAVRVHQILVHGQTSLPRNSQPLQPQTSQPSHPPSGQLLVHLSGQPFVPPNGQPSLRPNGQPSLLPNGQPSLPSNGQPSLHPNGQPSPPNGQPSLPANDQPSLHPNGQPSVPPNGQLSLPANGQPSLPPNGQPSLRPNGQPLLRPNGQPSLPPNGQLSLPPNGQPLLLTFGQLSLPPNGQPLLSPNCQPSLSTNCKPSLPPIGQPSLSPNCQPSLSPNGQPSLSPNGQPSLPPNGQPSVLPNGQQSLPPNGQPSLPPNGQPSLPPNGQPSLPPNGQPSLPPNGQPSLTSYGQPSLPLSGQPSLPPNVQPLQSPNGQPSLPPNGQPSLPPNGQPLLPPSGQPLLSPNGQPSQTQNGQPLLPPNGQPSLPSSGQPMQPPNDHPKPFPNRQFLPLQISLPSLPPNGQCLLSPNMALTRDQHGQLFHPRMHSPNPSVHVLPGNAPSTRSQQELFAHPLSSSHLLSPTSPNHPVLTANLPSRKCQLTSGTSQHNHSVLPAHVPSSASPQEHFTNPLIFGQHNSSRFLNPASQHGMIRTNLPQIQPLPPSVTTRMMESNTMRQPTPGVSPQATRIPFNHLRYMDPPCPPRPSRIISSSRQFKSVHSSMAASPALSQRKNTTIPRPPPPSYEASVHCSTGSQSHLNAPTQGITCDNSPLSDAPSVSKTSELRPLLTTRPLLVSNSPPRDKEIEATDVSDGEKTPSSDASKDNNCTTSEKNISGQEKEDSAVMEDDDFLDWILHSPSADVPVVTVPEGLNIDKQPPPPTPYSHSNMSPSPDEREPTDDKETCIVIESSPESGNQTLQKEATRVGSVNNGLWKKVGLGRPC